MNEAEMSQLNETELRHRFERGDFHSESESVVAQRLLRAFEREAEFLAQCERADLSAALDTKKLAKTANQIAIFAAIMAAIASVLAVMAYVR